MLIKWMVEKAIDLVMPLDRNLEPNSSFFADFRNSVYYLHNTICRNFYAF